MHPAPRLCRPAALAALLALAASLGLAKQALAQWKWISPSGVVQYSDQPPPADTPLRDILAQPRPTSVAPAEPASGASAAAAQAVQRQLQRRKAQQQARRKALQDAQAAQQQAEAMQRMQLCQQAQQRLQVLESGRRIRQVQADGQQAYLGSEQLQAQRQQAQALVDSNCR